MSEQEYPKHEEASEKEDDDKFNYFDERLLREGVTRNCKPMPLDF